MEKSDENPGNSKSRREVAAGLGFITYVHRPVAGNRSTSDR